ncbi:MAG: hypothetical protein ACLQK4_07610 [Acidimicrobiales bacterium]|jgi:hypothetical protein
MRARVARRYGVARWALAACLTTGAAGIGAIATTGTSVLATTTAARLARVEAKSTLSGGFQAVTVVPGSKDAIAVGQWYGKTTSGDVIEEWTGSTWKDMTPPSLGTSVTGSGLSDVWAASASDAWAVGYMSTNSGSSVQLIHWDGKSWSLQAVAGLPANSTMHGISGSSSSDVWCVGVAFDDKTLESTPLELHFTGKSWKLSTEGPSDSGLSAVSAASASDIWAIGGEGKTNTQIVVHYDGKSWKNVKSPVPSVSSFNAVSASGSTAWVVGSAGTPSSLYAMEWKGSKWEAVKFPAPTGTYPYLSGVVTLSSSSAWAGGSTGSGVFMEEFAKGKWSVEKVPAVGHGPSLAAFAGSSSRNIWAVGQYFTGKICVSPELPLTYHHTSAWKVVAAAAPKALISHC